MHEAEARVGLPEVLVAVLATAEAAVRLLHTLAAAPPQPAPGPTPSVLDNARTARGSITQYCATLLCLLSKVGTEKLLVAANSIHRHNNVDYFFILEISLQVIPFIHIQYPLTLPRQAEC